MGHIHTCMNTLFEFSDTMPVIRALPNVKISGDLILWAAACCRANMYAGSFMSISGGESRMTIETFTAIGPCIVTKLSPMKKFQTAYEARGMSGSAAHAVYVCTWSLPKMCVTWLCYRLSAIFLRIYEVWLGGRGSELRSVYENWYMNIDHVVYMFMLSQ